MKFLGKSRLVIALAVLLAGMVCIGVSSAENEQEAEPTPKTKVPEGEKTPLQKGETPGKKQGKDGQEKGKGVADPDKDNKEAKADDGNAEYVLSQEIADRLQEIAPDLLELRMDADKLYTEYRSLSLGKGLTLYRDAEKKLPGLQREIEKFLDKLEREYEKQVKPAEKLQEQLQEEEKEILEKMDRLAQRGKRSEKLDDRADEIGKELANVEAKLEALKAAGMPSYTLGDSSVLFVEHLLRLSEQQMKCLKNLEKEHADYLEGRIYIEHLRADLATAKKEGASSREEKLQRKLDSVIPRFITLHESVYEHYGDILEDLETDQEKLMPKIERTMGKRSGRKYQDLLSTLEKKIDSVNDVLRFLNLCGKGIVPPPAKDKKEGKDTDKDADEDLRSN